MQKIFKKRRQIWKLNKNGAKFENTENLKKTAPNLKFLQQKSAKFRKIKHRLPKRGAKFK